MIVVLDYGMGNLRSVERAFRHIGVEVSIQPNLVNASKLVIPGVGAFGAAMERIAPLAKEIHEFAQAGKPILGICLGQQLLFERSEEFGSHRGLGLIEGSVKYLPKKPETKVPHVGWNTLEPKKSHPLIAGLPENGQVYFVHSLYTECSNEDDIVATTEHGLTFPAIVARGAVWGCQFHPEKSGDVGLEMLRAFAS